MLNYAIEKELNDATGVDISNLAAKRNFIALKAQVNKLDINKLVNVATSLDNLKAKVDDLDVGKLKEVPVDLKKLSDVVDKTDINGLVTTTFLKTKISGLVKKRNHDAKISEDEKKQLEHDHNNKYVTTQEFMIENFTARIKQANLATKADNPDFVKKTGFDEETDQFK